MVSVIVTYYVKPGKKDEYMSIVMEHITKTKQEEGCVFFDLFTEPAANNDSALTLVEVWKDQAALDEHLLTEHFLKSRDLLTPIREERSDRHVYSKAY